MAEQFSPEWARGIVEGGVEKAQAIMNDPQQLDELLQSLQEKLSALPETAANAFRNVPLMASMVKSYVTQEYTEVSPKVVVSLISAFVYFVAQKDLIPDSTPIVGYLDDIAVAGIAMAINEPELNAYAQWRKQNAPASEPVKLPAPEEAAPAQPLS